MYILPSLCASERFSVGLMMQYLESSEPGELRVPCTAPLLYSVLVLARGKLDKMDITQEKAFLSVVSVLAR